MRLLLPIIAVLLLTSCRTTKTVTQTKIVTDSTTERALREHARMLEEELQAASRDSAIKYVTDVVFEECDSVAAPATVLFDNGKLASVTGQLRSVKQQLSQEVSERNTLIRTVDSQRLIIDSMSAHKSIEYKDRIKTVEKKYIPWWIYAAMAGLVVFAFRTQIRRLINPKILPTMFPLFLLGTWPVGLLLLGGAVVFFYFAYLARKSGWKRQDQKTGRTYYGNEKLPYTKIGQFWFGVACLAVLVVYLIIQIGER